MNSSTSEPQQQTSGMRLLRTKLFIPSPHPELVARPALDELLDGVFRRKLVLISAPAGFGKTTLLSAWIAKRDFPVAWVSLDERDNDPTRFWSYFIAGLQTLFPQVGQTALTMLQSPQPPVIDITLTELVNDLSVVEEEFLLVLDDYHTIESQHVHQGLTFLLENLPGNMHLAIASRTDPPLPLPLMRARRVMLELGPQDLRFTANEAAAFLNRVMGLDLSADEVGALENLTEGWIAGLQLAALSMQDVEDVSAFLGSFSGSHRFIFDYLAQEVLDRQEEDTRRFLLETAVLDRMNADLCQAVTGFSDSQERLKQLERAKLFLVPLDQARRWYRYHHLFSEFLHAQLEQQGGPQVLVELNRRAARWYDAHELEIEAVHHAIHAQDFAYAAELVNRTALEMFRRSELMTLLDWLDALPEEILDADARLNMTYAWSSLATGRPQDVEPCLEKVEKLLGVAADGSLKIHELPPGVRGALGEISCIRSSLAFNRMETGRVVVLAEQALAYLTQDVEKGLFNNRDDLRAVAFFNLALASEFSGQVLAAIEYFQEMIDLSPENIHLAPMAYSHLAQLHTIRGQLRSAEAVNLQAMKLAEQVERVSPLFGMVYTGLGNLYAEWNRLDQAAENLLKGLELGKQWRQWEILLNGYFGLVRVYMAQRNLPQASFMIDELNRYADLLQVDWAAPQLDAFRALWHARRGELEKAEAWAESCGVRIDAPIPYMQETEAMILARVLISLGDVELAMRLLNGLLKDTQSRERWGRVIELHIYQALLWQLQGEMEPARVSVARALELAKPEGYMRIFLDEGQTMRELFAELRQHDELLPEDLKTYVEQIWQGFLQEAEPIARGESPSPGQRQENIGRRREPTAQGLLSEREQEVLRLLAQGLTNQEIADDLYISVNTVKSHLKNIYAALEVRNRAEAASKAKELGLI